MELGVSAFFLRGTNFVDTLYAFAISCASGEYGFISNL